MAQHGPEMDITGKCHRERPLDGLFGLHLDAVHHRMARAPAADCEQGRQPQQGGPAVIDGKDGMPPVKTKAEWLCKADEPDGKGRQQQERHVVAVDEPVAANPRQ